MNNVDKYLNEIVRPKVDELIVKGITDGCDYIDSELFSLYFKSEDVAEKDYIVNLLKQNHDQKKELLENVK